MYFILVLITKLIFILELFHPLSLAAVTTLRPRVSQSMIETYLARFGYIDLPDKGNQSEFGRSSALDPKQVTNGIKLFQEKYGLIVTGVFDEATRKKMQQPRCGVKDILGRSQLGKWRDKNLKYKFVGRLTPHMKSSVVKEAIQEGFDYWAKVTPLTFTEVSDDEKAHFLLKFRSRWHDDDYPFDGQDGTLAHAFFPSDGGIHFDMDETFTEGEDRGYNLRIVAAHEIGHALGLPHSYDSDALMAAYYAGYTDKTIPLLNTNDISSIQRIYGRNPQPTTPLVSTETTRQRRMTRIVTDSITEPHTKYPTTIPPNPTTSQLSTTQTPIKTEELTTTNEPTTTTATERLTTTEEITQTKEPITTTLPISTTTEETEPIEEEITTNEVTVATKREYYTHHQWPKVVPGPLEPDVCSTETRITVAFMGKDSRIYFVIKYRDTHWIYQNVMHQSMVSRGWPHKFGNFLKITIPTIIDAIIFIMDSSSHYLFSGTKIFIYDEFGYYRAVVTTGKDVRYAFNLRDRRTIVVTKDNTAWTFNPQTYEFTDSQPISNLFQGIPLDIDAAAEDYPWTQDINFIFFFKGREYYKYDAHNKNRVTSGDVGGPFFGCRQFPVPKYI